MPTYKNFDRIRFNMEKELVEALINSVSKTKAVHPTLVIGVLEKVLLGYHEIEKEVDNLQAIFKQIKI